MRAREDNGDPADGLSAEIERLRGEVEHWKAHAEEAGRGFAQVCKDAARMSARNVRLAEELEAARQRPTAPPEDRVVAAVDAVLCHQGIHGWHQRTPNNLCPWCEWETLALAAEAAAREDNGGAGVS